MESFAVVRRRGFIVLSLLFLALTQFAPVTVHAQKSPDSGIEIPEVFNLKYLNGERYQRPFFSSGDISLELQPGRQQLIIEYEAVWELNADDHDRVVSEPMSVTFTAAAGRHYLLRYPEPGSVKEATAYARQPVVTIIDSDTNQAVPSEQAYQLEKQAFLQRFVKPMPAAQSDAKEVAQSGKEVMPAAVSTQQNSGRALEMLHYWWQQAGDSQRREFLRSIEQ